MSNIRNVDDTFDNGLEQRYQGNFLNKGLKIVQIPTVNLGYLTNDSSSEEIDNSINLNQIDLNWSDFCNLFFRSPCGSFYINPENSMAYPLIFSYQKYSTSQNKEVDFVLSDQIKKAWSIKFSKPESVIPPTVNILLSRNGFLNKGLSSVTDFCLGLSIDEVITSLLNTKEITPAKNSCAKVKFVISCRTFYKPLNVALLINFKFVNSIPNYKNIQPLFCENEKSNIKHYSNDCKSSNGSDFDYDDITLTSSHDNEDSISENGSIESTSKTNNSNVESSHSPGHSEYSFNNLSLNSSPLKNNLIVKNKINVVNSNKNLLNNDILTVSADELSIFIDETNDDKTTSSSSIPWSAN